MKCKKHEISIAILEHKVSVLEEEVKRQRDMYSQLFPEFLGLRDTLVELVNDFGLPYARAKDARVKDE